MIEQGCAYCGINPARASHRGTCLNCGATLPNWPIVQLEDSPGPNGGDAGSNPAGPTFYMLKNAKNILRARQRTMVEFYAQCGPTIIQRHRP